MKKIINKSNVFLLLVFALLPAMLILAFTAYKQKQAEEALMRQEATAKVRILSGIMENKLEGVRQFLLLLSHERTIQNRDVASCNSLMIGISKNFPEYTTIGAADPAGNIFCFGMPMRKQVNIADRAYFQHAIKGHYIGIGESVVGRITGKRSLHIGYAVRDAAETVQAVVFAPFDLDSLEKTFSRIIFPAESIFCND